jgi:hypothetical protein
MSSFALKWLILQFFVVLSLFAVKSRNVDALTELDRLSEYRKRNYTYPLTDFTPNTPGWKRLMNERLAQIAEIDSEPARYEGYYQVVHAATLAPNFTEYGFGLAKCPDDLLHALQQGIHDGLPNAGYEEESDAINAPNLPWFITRPDLTERVQRELHSYTEEWVGFPLTAHLAYGFRLYRNESQLYMHTDRLLTHVVSFILHIGSSDDAEPWPIFIEDLHGRTHELILTPGDILFYESSKCFHGRPRRFNGSWYSSVFVFYYPKDNWIDQPHELEVHYAIPPIWKTEPPHQKSLEKLDMVGSTMREPNCPDDWCRAGKDTIKWRGPAEVGKLITPAMERIPFFPGTSFADEL